MTSYAEALREVSAARGELPGRRAYPGYLYSDLATLYERCGRIRGRGGSVTVLPRAHHARGRHHAPGARTSPATSPRARSCSRREVHARGVYPPVDALASLSRLMRNGAGPGRTREDHLELAAQLLAALARARQVRELAEIVGDSALSATDQLYLEFATQFERGLLDQQRHEQREMAQTLDRCWDVANVLPRRELTMLPSRLLDAHPPRKG